MFITRFICHDDGHTEDYYYHTSKDAMNHMNLFADDDSALYDRIEVLDDAEMLIASISF